MMRTFLVPLTSTLSLGVGLWMGGRLQDYKVVESGTSCNQNTSSLLTAQYGHNDERQCAAIRQLSDAVFSFLTPPTVAAASSIVPASQSSQLPVSSINRNVSLVSDVVKLGLPSLDNVIPRDGYILSYNRGSRTPNWVLEHLTRERVKAVEGVNRDKCDFKPDQAIHPFFRATNEDFKKSGYDRGHLAAAGNHRWSQNLMEQTFLLSNMAPQVGKGFNRDAWNSLEQMVRHLTKEYRNVYVCTGPLFLPKREADNRLYVKYEVIGQNHVAVPTHFFKVVVAETDKGERDLLAYVMPNAPIGEHPNLSKYLVPPETIERAGGILLFEHVGRKTLRTINGNKV